MKNKLFFLKTILFLFLLIPQQSNTFDGNKVALGLAFVVGAFFSENVSKLCAKKARKQKRLQQKIYLWYQSPKFYKKVSSVSSYFFWPLMVAGKTIITFGIFSENCQSCENKKLKNKNKELNEENKNLCKSIESLENNNSSCDCRDMKYVSDTCQNNNAVTYNQDLAKKIEV